jgi:transposase
MSTETQVFSCYEAGRDGFWIHRSLTDNGIDNKVIDSSSIQVDRRKRKAKTDSLDVKSLVDLLVRYFGGEQRAFRVCRVPSVGEEDERRLHRERKRLIKERGSHTNRIGSLLIAHGIRIEINKHFLEKLAKAQSPAGYDLPEDLKAELEREYARYVQVDQQIKHLEKAQKERVKEAKTKSLEMISELMRFNGIGPQTSWILVMEFLGWREFKNRRQLGSCAGLAPTPYASGDMNREQGISKAGNVWVRSQMVEISWLWLRYQPGSGLAQWFERRYGGGSPRMRRIGIVALARKLLIALWRYVTQGVIPEGALLAA